MLLNTRSAIKPFLDNRYDLEEWIAKIRDLVENNEIVLFKFADGSVIPLPSVKYVMELTPFWDKLTIGVSGKAVVLTVKDKDLSVEGSISAHLSNFVAGGTVNLKKTHIDKLTVTSDGECKATSLERGTDSIVTGSAGYVNNYSGTTKANKMKVNGNLQATTVRSVLLSSSSERFRAVPTYTDGLLNYSAGTGDAETNGATLIPAELYIEGPTKCSRYGNNNRSVTYRAPWWTGSRWEYYDLYDVYDAITSDNVTIGHYKDFMLYPLMWRAEDSTHTREWMTFGGGTPSVQNSIVVVHNVSDSSIELANAWEFSRRRREEFTNKITEDGTLIDGLYSTFSKVKLGAYTSREFIFRYVTASSGVSYAYMHPTGVL